MSNEFNEAIKDNIEMQVLVQIILIEEILDELGMT